MPKTIELYLVESKTDKKKKFIYPRDVLDASELCDDVSLATAFPADLYACRWCSMDLLDPFTMGDDAKVKEKQLTRHPVTGQMWRDPDWFDGALISVAVTGWDLPYSKDRDGYLSMSPPIARVLSDIIKLHAYGDGGEDPLSLHVRRTMPAA